MPGAFRWLGGRPPGGPSVSVRRDSGSLAARELGRELCSPPKAKSATALGEPGDGC
ncbi:hypothetical protein SUDANB66_04007 [Streptomyces sp. SudanB66_2053]